MMLVRLMLIVGFVMVIYFTAQPGLALGQAAEGGTTTILAIDEGAAAQKADLDAAHTAALVSTSFLPEGLFSIVTFGAEQREIIIRNVPSDAVGANAAVQSELTVLSGSAGASDLFGTLVDSYSYLLDNGAPAGSRLVVISTGRILGVNENSMALLRDLGERFSEKGWTIEVIGLPSSSEEASQLLSELANASSGVYFDLSAPNGIPNFLQTVSQIEGDALLDTKITDGSVARVIPISPFTESTLLLFYRSDPGTTFTLYRPNGIVVTDDAGETNIIETPHSVLIRLREPVAGDWIVLGSGNSDVSLHTYGQNGIPRGRAPRLDSNVSLHTYGQNPLTLRLIDTHVLAAGAEAAISAGSFREDVVQPIQDAWIDARVTSPTGRTIVYELYDNGLNGDAEAGDGAFTTLITTPMLQGVHNVDLTMRWIDSNASLNSQTSFRTEFFPVILLADPENAEQLTEGEEALLATAEVKLDGYPYLVGPSQITAIFEGGDTQFTGNVKAVEIVEQGRAWRFHVFGIPPEAGRYDLSIMLTGEHLGREFTTSTPGDSPSFHIINPSSVPALVEFEFEIPSEVYDRSFPVWIFVVIAPLIVVTVYLIIKFLRRPSPFGLLYDDKGRIVADFFDLPRPFMRKLFYRSTIKVSEVPEFPLDEGAVFRFTSTDAQLVYKQDPHSPGLRVNGRPAGDVIRLDQDIWLGVGGRLLTFSSTRETSSNQDAVSSSRFGSAVLDQFSSKDG